MSVASAAVCPHCQSENPSANAFCEACGKALPRAGGGPRVVAGDVIPQSAAGRVLVGEELTKQMKKVFTTLLCVGILQVVIGGVLVAVVRNSRGASQELPVLVMAMFVIGAIFIGLAFWSRKAPLPAAIVGLVIYSTLVVLNVITSVSQLGQGGPKSGIGGLGIGWLDVVIIVILVQGIQAAIKYRKLQETAV